MEIRRFVVLGLGKKFHETTSQPTKNWAWWSIPVIPAKREV
jgi:hypothetical protein